MPERTPRKPVSEMTPSEITAALAPLTRLQLTAMLLHLSHYAPAAFDEALSRYSTEGGEH